MLIRLGEVFVAGSPHHVGQSLTNLTKRPVERIALRGLIEHEALVALLRPVVIVRLVVEAVETQQLDLAAVYVAQGVNAQP